MQTQDIVSGIDSRLAELKVEASRLEAARAALTTVQAPRVQRRTRRTRKPATNVVRLPDAGRKRFGPRRRAAADDVLALLTTGMVTGEIAQHLGVSRSSVLTRLRELANEGLVVQTGRAGSRHAWEPARELPNWVPFRVQELTA